MKRKHPTNDETPVALNAAVAEETARNPPKPATVYRKDYQPLPYTIDRVNLELDIHENLTIVTARMQLAKNEVCDQKGDAVIELDGDETAVKLIELKVDGKDLVPDKDYRISPSKLTILHPKHGDWLETVCHIVPETNTNLLGLYKSRAMYLTHCEAMGFRRITYFLDRPDNMSVYEVRLIAHAKNYPVLLSNGNLIEEGTAHDGRHYATWSDPFPKPSYLFAAVIGDLASIRDQFTTMSGRTVQLAMFSEAQSIHKMHYAMGALKRAMKWDEDRFGLEYDLDTFMVVATADFNMGAMENKALNIFNTTCVLADQHTSTDNDFERVEGIIAHEYFHNWTGNRVTCRDWFQLTLKEGLTVFRDQEFSSDMNSRDVNRIENVKVIQARQFSEDAGPMSHPIRPDSFISMDNFYSTTVYRKGSEVIRMYQTILGVDGFNKGMKLYFERHDGTGVTCDEFLAAMADANGVDLSQFALWYSTPGTPTVSYSYKYDSEKGDFILTLSQSSQSEKPLHIPVAVGLLDKSSSQEVKATTILHLKEATQSFTFPKIDNDVVPSILRGFSAPVKLESISGEADEESLAFLAANDTDGFNRWGSGQKLYSSLILQFLTGDPSQKTVEQVKQVFGRILREKETTDYSIQAYALSLPTQGTLAEEMEPMDPPALHKAWTAAKAMLARHFQAKLLERYTELTEIMSQSTDFKTDSISIGRRRLRNVILSYLSAVKSTGEEQLIAAQLATAHFESASCMTDKMAACTVLASMDGAGKEARDAALAKFYQNARGDDLVINKWFGIQASADDLPDILKKVKKLTEHQDFSLKSPNRVRYLIGMFTANLAAFHDEEGAGYEFVADILAQLDKINPTLSGRMASCLIQWRRFGEKRGGLMKKQLEKLLTKQLSIDLYEVVERGLKQ